MTHCPRAKSDTTPCVLRDGDAAIVKNGSSHDVCVGCGWRASRLSENVVGVQIGTIDMTPTWESLVDAIITMVDNGGQPRLNAIRELRRCAIAADAFNLVQKSTRETLTEKSRGK